MDKLTAIGPCTVCDRLFQFDPDQVGSVLIDPVTRRPPDVDAAGNAIAHPDPEAVARSEKRPYCPRCARALNDSADIAGLGRPFDETDTARS